MKTFIDSEGKFFSIEKGKVVYVKDKLTVKEKNCIRLSESYGSWNSSSKVSEILETYQDGTILKRVETRRGPEKIELCIGSK